MLHLIERCFGDKLKTGGWLTKLKEIIPSYGQSLIENPALCQRVRAATAEVLNIINVNVKEIKSDSSLSAVYGV
jgi:malate dehydrogenase (quinone)